MNDEQVEMLIDELQNHHYETMRYLHSLGFRMHAAIVLLCFIAGTLLGSVISSMIASRP